MFQNDEAFSISVVNIYTEDHLTHTFSENFHQGVKYSSQIESHQAELIKDKIIDQKSISISDLQIDYLNLDNSVRNN